MLSKKLETILNKQIGLENYASHYYLTMASWCETTGLPGAAAFLYRQSDEERGHMMKLFKYVNATGGRAIVSKVSEVPQNFKSLLHLFELVFKHECEVTSAINEIVDLSLKEKDYATFNFLQWYVAEQHEEEALFTRIVDLLKLTGSDGKGLYYADKEIGGIQPTA